MAAETYDHPDTCPEDPDLRAAWGCDGMSSASAAAAYEWRGQTIRLDRCPIGSVTHATWELASFVPWLESGTWPVQGGLLDQSVTFVRAAAVFRGEVSRLERKKIDEEAERGRTK